MWVPGLAQAQGALPGQVTEERREQPAVVLGGMAKPAAQGSAGCSGCCASSFSGLASTLREGTGEEGKQVYQGQPLRSGPQLFRRWSQTPPPVSLCGVGLRASPYWRFLRRCSGLSGNHKTVFRKMTCVRSACLLALSHRQEDFFTGSPLPLSPWAISPWSSRSIVALGSPLARRTCSSHSPTSRLPA